MSTEPVHALTHNDVAEMKFMAKLNDTDAEGVRLHLYNQLKSDSRQAWFDSKFLSVSLLFEQIVKSSLSLALVADAIEHGAGNKTLADKLRAHGNVPKSVDGGIIKAKGSASSSNASAPNVVDSTNSGPAQSDVGNALSDQQKKMLEKLAQYRKSHQLIDLHAHLLGMGSAEFWIDEVMCKLVPKWKEDANAIEFYGEDAKTTVTHKNWSSAQRQPMNNDKVWRDVVYDKRTLLEAFQDEDVSKMSEDNVRAKFANIFSKFKTKNGTPLSEQMVKKTVFDARKGELEDREGLLNSTLVEALEDNKDLRELLEMAFEMKDDKIGDRFHEKFTPQFYPRRFALKDSLYSQYPVVLDHLLNHVLARYWESGVGYVELSVGLGDVLKPWMWKHLVQPQLTSEGARQVQVRYLAAFNRENCWIPLDCDLDQVERDLENRIAKDEEKNKESDEVTKAKIALAKAKNLPSSLGSFRDEAIKKAEEELKKAEEKSKGVGAKKSGDKDNLEGALQTIKKINAKVKESHASEPKTAMCVHLAKAVVELAQDGDEQYLNLFQSSQLEKINNLFPQIAESREANTKDGLHERLVGLDLVGNEFLFPFSPFSAGKYIGKIYAERKERKGNFGLRLHAGEASLGSISSGLDHRTLAHLCAISHAVTRYATSIQTLEELLPTGDVPTLRIGHGNLFAHAFTADSSNEVTSLDYCRTRATEAKELLLEANIPIEINQTSNDTLLANGGDAFWNMIKKDIPFVFATDDDGIWCCESAEGEFKSVANEFYRAIMLDDKDRALNDSQSITTIVMRTKAAAFDATAAATYFT